MIILCPCSSLESLPQDVIHPKLIIRLLPTGCISPSTAPTWVHITGPILQDHTAPARIPVDGSSSSPHVPLQAAALAQGLLLRGPSPGCGSVLALVAAGLLFSHFSLFSPSCCCAAVFSFLKSSVTELKTMSLVAQIWLIVYPFCSSWSCL